MPLTARGSIIALCLLSITSGAARAGQSPTPRPFPQPGQSQPPAPARPTAPPPPTSGTTPPAAASPASPAAAPEEAPTEAILGVPIYPGAEFITSYDAGHGQRFYLFGSTASFVDLVNFYRNVLKQRGDQVYDVPATHEFDVGRFREETMAFPPGVTIKDFESEVSQGYPNPKPGAQPERFPSIIQIVPVVPER
jgi:hypothetical protein